MVVVMWEYRGLWNYFGILNFERYSFKVCEFCVSMCKFFLFCWDKVKFFDEYCRFDKFGGFICVLLVLEG